ncbi:MAG TPA: carboxypeptidase regulatory-like domain-containing protein [Bryobacteraceae bacterium]|nr:carboxypeptidase regulatory-like domain-containing protein [Bryobacteraceae bacterium]
MNRITILLVISLCLPAAWAQDAPVPSLRGRVTDPSGAAVPGAIVQLRGPGGERRAKTDPSGQYSLPSLKPGKYQIRVMAKDFSIAEMKDFAIDRPKVFDIQLAIHTETRVIDVEDGLRRVRAEPDSNGSAVVIGESQIGALSDDPDELALQLQALAGPAPGPDGGQFYIDGFTGGSLPPKSSIREVRINSNPFSPEYDRPGFARVEIFTKPGSDSFHGQAFTQYDDDVLNARNPLLTQATQPAYRAQLDGFNIGGPLKKNRASLTLDLERRQIHENALVLATTLDAGLNPVKVSQALPTPQSRTAFSPRLDYTLNRRNTLVVRYQDLRIGLDNQGVGDFNLASRAFHESQTERTLQITETAMISPRAINETRLQYLRVTDQATATDTTPAILVLGAFNGGGPTVGNSGSANTSWELTNISTYTKKDHTLKWGLRLRQTLLTDTSLRDFAGTFTFFTLAQYQATLALQAAGYTGPQIVQMGAGPSQFSLSAGTPVTKVSQFDAGIFVNDDWRARPNLTLSYGVRYEAQSHLGDRSDWAPRLGIAWGFDSRANRPAKTVLRAGFGAFYDRIPVAVILNRLRYNGATQQSYLILSPTFYPVIPPAGVLEAASEPQQLRPVASGVRAPRLYQASLGIDRQLNQSSHVTLTWTGARGIHLLNFRNINAPVDGGRALLYPFSDRSIRLLTESAGLSRRNQLVANASVNYKRLFLFGYYSLSYGKDNNEGIPADPYDLRAEWGPSSYADMRHRMAAGATIPVRWNFSVNPFVVANSGVPYNITTGLDPNSTGFPQARPSLLTGAGASACQGSGTMYESGFGCFNLTPGPGTPAIQRNYGRGPSNWNVALRVSRTWAFGREARGGAMESGGVPGGMGASASHGGGGGPMGDAAPTGAGPGRRYNLTLSASTLNALNHPNFAPPNGDLSSGYFGQYRSLGGLIVIAHGGAPTTYNRKIDLQLRFTF